MKKLLLVILCSLSLSSINAQHNLGFETWTSQDPAYWTTSNELTALGAPVTVFKDSLTPGTDLVSAYLTVKPCPFCGLAGFPNPFPGFMVQLDSSTVRPVTCQFKWRGNVAIGDTAIIGAAVTLMTSTIGTAYLNVLPGTNQATWTVASIPFSYGSAATPDTVKLGAMTDQYLLFGYPGSTNASTYIYVDEFNLTGTLGTAMLETNNALIFAFPNPSSTSVNFNLLGTDASMMQVTDLSGNIVYTDDNIEIKQKLDVSQYASGSYVVKFLSAKKEYVGTARFNVIR